MSAACTLNPASNSPALLSDSLRSLHTPALPAAAAATAWAMSRARSARAASLASRHALSPSTTHRSRVQRALARARASACSSCALRAASAAG